MFKVLNEGLLKKTISHWENTDEMQTRTAYGYLEGWASIIINFILAVLKVACSLWINSISLLADAFHTLSDVCTSIAVIVGFKVSKKPRDNEHPFGHGRAENIVTFFVSGLLIIIGLQFLKESIEKFFNPEPLEYKGLVFIVMLFSALVKEWLYSFAKFLGVKIKSQALVADAWHHRSDAIASLLIGVALLATRFGYYSIDAILGILISIMIIYTGLTLIKECSSEILGKAPSAEFVKEVKDLVLNVEGVKNIHDIEVHQYGQQKYVNVHIEVEPELNVKQSHSIAEFAEELLHEKMHVSSLIHVDPYKN